MSNRRRSDRYAVTLPVVIKGGRGTENTLTANVSAHGVAIFTERPFPPRQYVELELRLPPDGQAIAVTAMVARTTDRLEDRAGIIHPGVAFDFYLFDSKGRTAWRAFLDRLRGSGPPVPAKRPEAASPGRPPLEGETESAAQAVRPTAEATFLVKPRDVGRLWNFFRTELGAHRAKIETPVLKAPGTPVEVVVVHPETQAEYSLMGQVVAASEHGRGRGPMIEVGLEEMSEAGRASFRSFITSGRIDETTLDEDSIEELPSGAIKAIPPPALIPEQAPEPPRIPDSAMTPILEPRTLPDKQGPILEPRTVLDQPGPLLPASSSEPATQEIHRALATDPAPAPAGGVPPPPTEPSVRISEPLVTDVPLTGMNATGSESRPIPLPAGIPGRTNSVSPAFMIDVMPPIPSELLPRNESLGLRKADVAPAVAPLLAGREPLVSPPSEARTPIPQLTRGPTTVDVPTYQRPGSYPEPPLPELVPAVEGLVLEAPRMPIAHYPVTPDPIVEPPRLGVGRASAAPPAPAQPQPQPPRPSPEPATEVALPIARSVPLPSIVPPRPSGSGAVPAPGVVPRASMPQAPTPAPPAPPAAAPPSSLAAPRASVAAPPPPSPAPRPSLAAPPPPAPAQRPSLAAPPPPAPPIAPKTSGPPPVAPKTSGPPPVAKTSGPPVAPKTSGTPPPPPRPSLAPPTPPRPSVAPPPGVPVAPSVSRSLSSAAKPRAEAPPAGRAPLARSPTFAAFFAEYHSARPSVSVTGVDGEETVRPPPDAPPEPAQRPRLHPAALEPSADETNFDDELETHPEEPLPPSVAQVVVSRAADAPRTRRASGLNEPSWSNHRQINSEGTDPELDRDIALARARVVRSPASVTACYHLGRLLLRRGNEDALGEATVQLSRAVELEPNHPGAHLAAAELAVRQGNFDSAADHLQRARRLGYRIDAGLERAVAEGRRSRS